jgi:hypothetical protein
VANHPVYLNKEVENIKATRKNRGVNLKSIIAVTIVFTIGLAVMPCFVPKAYSGKGTAFLGGMVAGHLVTDAIERSERRTRAEKYQAYGRPRTYRQAAPAPSAPTTPATQPTAQQRLDQLDKLAAGGYIAPEKYKAKKKAILDGI